MKHAAKEGSLEASANLGRILVTGVYDYKNGTYILRPNASLALFFLNHSIEDEFPMGFHTLAEVVHYNSIELPKNFIDLYNLTTEENKCELSVHFYAKSVLRGYLKSWLTLAEKRYILKDYDGAHLLYSYSSFLGLP